MHDTIDHTPRAVDKPLHFTKYFKGHKLGLIGTVALSSVFIGVLAGASYYHVSLQDKPIVIPKFVQQWVLGRYIEKGATASIIKLHTIISYLLL